MSLSLQKGQKAGGSSGHEPGCLGSPSLVPQSWRTPGELLVFSLCWNPEEGCLSSGVDELASKSKDKQQAKPKSILLPWPLTWAATKRCGPEIGWVLLCQ